MIDPDTSGSALLQLRGISKTFPVGGALGARSRLRALLLSAIPQTDRDLLAPLDAKPGTPELVDPTPGCAFAARCSQAHERCTRADPPLVSFGSRHRVRCHLFSALAEAA